MPWPPTAYPLATDLSDASPATPGSLAGYLNDRAAVANGAVAELVTHEGAADPHGDRAYAASLFASNDALLYKGAINCSTNPNYPAADAGHAYKVSVAGKIGGASGPNVEVGDLLVCTVDGSAAGTQAAVGANWDIIQVNLDGAVIGPASATDGRVVTFDGTSGRLVKDSTTPTAPTAAQGTNTTQIASTAYVQTEAGLLIPRSIVDGSTLEISGGSLRIKDAGVTLAKMADATASTVIGRAAGAGTGPPTLLSVTQQLAMFPAASLTVASIIEIATAAETTTGTDATRAVSPDGLAGSDYGKRVLTLQVTDPNGAVLTTGDGQAYYRCPAVLNGWNIIAVASNVATASTAGIPTVQIARIRAATPADVLSTKLTIDANETDSSTAATAAVVSGGNRDIATADVLRIDVDVAGTGTLGLSVEITFQLP